MTVTRFPLIAGCAVFAACGNDVVGERATPAICRAPAVITATSAGAPALFTLEDSAQLTSGQEHYLGSVRANPASAEVHLARLAPDAAALLQPGDTVLLTVSPTRSFSAIGSRVTPSGSWEGRIENEFGSALLVLHEGDLTGTLQSVPNGGPISTFAFRPLGGGMHALVCLDASKFPPD